MARWRVRRCRACWSTRWSCAPGAAAPDGVAGRYPRDVAAYLAHGAEPMPALAADARPRTATTPTPAAEPPR